MTGTPSTLTASSPGALPLDAMMERASESELQALLQHFTVANAHAQQDVEARSRESLCYRPDFLLTPLPPVG